MKAHTGNAHLKSAAFVGKTVDDDILGRGIIIDETETTVGVRFHRERRKMSVHYIPKSKLIDWNGP